MAANASNVQKGRGKGDPARGGARRAIEFLRRHFKAVAIGLGVALLLVLVAAAYAFQKKQGEERASRMLLNAFSQQQQEMILSQYPGSSVAPAALLALASGAYHAGAFDQAYAYYVQFEEEFPQHRMILVASLGKLMCDEARGLTAKALEGFSKFADDHPDHFLRPQALFGKARCLRALGQHEAARRVYEDFISSKPDSAWTPTAKSSLAAMEMEMRALKQMK